MDIGIVAIQLLNAVQYGLVLFLVASGLTLVFGILGVINLAHGAFYMLGAYLAWWFTTASGSLLVGIAGAFALSFAGGALVETLLFKRLVGRDHLSQVLLSFGLILIIDEARQILFGRDVQSVPVPAWLAGSLPLSDLQSYPYYRLALIVFCLVVAIAIFLVISRTRLGMIVRAGAENREMARTLGIRLDRLNCLVFAAGIAFAALAGAVIAPVSTVFPGMGDNMLILSFVVVVLGGVGSVPGAAIGALMIGLIDTFGKVFLPQFAGMLVYLMMALVLLWRPTGILGTREI